MKVAFFDATRSALKQEEELLGAFGRVMRSGQYILGPEVVAFERAMALRLGVAHAVGVSSGTDALLAILVALGVGAGDEVIVPAYGFVATAEVVLRTGATPIFADVQAGSLLVDVASARVCVTSRTKAILAVHLFGGVADVESLTALGPPVIEDAAQALGAERRGRPVGGLGAAACFSFFPTKNLGGFGDGGLVTSNDPAIAARLQRLRSHGLAPTGSYVEIGGNFRLDALHAALLCVRLRGLDAALSRRRQLYRMYWHALDERGLADLLAPIESGVGAAPNQFVVQVTGEASARDRMRAELARQGVETKIYYRAALPDEPCFAALAPPPRPPVAARHAACSTLALPFYPELRDEEVAAVVEAAAVAAKALR